MSTPLTPSQLALVRVTFEQVVPIADQAAALFYARLFELDPSLRPLFRGDLESQGKKLMSALATVVACADDPERLRATLEPLGQRHVGYGVEERHYATVGTALLDTLEKGLGACFTDEVRAAWATTYGAVSGIMIDAARAVDLPKTA